METLIIPLHQKQRKQFSKLLEELSLYQGICAYLIPMDRNEKVLQGIQTFIKKIIMQSTNINAIELCGKYLNQKLVVAIDKLISFGNLQLISLAHSQIGDSLFTNILHLDNLQVINLSDCKLTLQGLQHFITVLLKSKQPWSRISLSGNDLRDTGVILLLDSISQQFEVLKLDMENVGITNHAVRTIINYLVDNPTCHLINIQNNFLNDMNKKEIKRITSIRKKLKSLDELISPGHNTASPVHLKLPYMYFNTKEVREQHTSISNPILLRNDNEVDQAEQLRSILDLQPQADAVNQIIQYLSGLKSRETNLAELTDNLTVVLTHLSEIMDKAELLNTKSKEHQSTQTIMHQLPSRTLLQQFIHPKEETTADSTDNSESSVKPRKIRQKSKLKETFVPRSSSAVSIASPSVQSIRSVRSMGSKSNSVKQDSSIKINASVESDANSQDSIPDQDHSMRTIKSNRNSSIHTAKSNISQPIPLMSKTNKSSSSAIASIQQSIRTISKHISDSHDSLKLHRVKSASIQYENDFESNIESNVESDMQHDNSIHSSIKSHPKSTHIHSAIKYENDFEASSVAESIDASFLNLLRADNETPKSSRTTTPRSNISLKSARSNAKSSNKSSIPSIPAGTSMWAQFIDDLK